MGTKSRDQGSVQVLEAMIVASIMLSAITFVVTYDQPIAQGANARDGLAQAAEDALAILAETPVDSPYGNDALSAYMAECLNGACDSLTKKLDQLIPEGGAYALYVSNGYESYPVYVKGTPSGEAISATQTFEPKWSSTFVTTATDLVGVGDALLTYELPIFNSNVVTPGGSHLLLKLEGSRADGSEFVMVGSYSTVARPTSDDAAAAASLAFIDGITGEPMAVHEPTLTVGEEFEVVLRLKESSAGGSVPAGVEVTIDMPRGWTGRAEAPDNDGWDILENATNKNGAYEGSSIRATLNETLQAGEADLRLRFTYHDDVLDFYPIHARLSRGALATASLLIRGEESGTPPALATPMIGMSVPAPMGNDLSDPTTWTIFAYAPFEDRGFRGHEQMSAEVMVRSVEIREADGNPIFGEVEGLNAMGGTWHSFGHSIVWSPHGDDGFSLTHDSLLNLTFTVEASGTAGPYDARGAFIPPVTFDGHTGKLVERSGWGFHRNVFLPATEDYEGFNGDASGGEVSWKAQHRAEADAVYRTTPLPGSVTYNATILGSVEDALYGAYVAASDRTVEIGNDVIIDANVQSLLFRLADANQKAGVTLRIYPPWSGDARDPILEQRNLDRGLLSGEVTQVALADLNGDGYLDPVVGTSNGRVLAYSGLTGQRIQGETFTAPVTAAAQQANTLPRITALAVAELGGEPHIVVGTDKNSDGVFVLNKSLGVAWSWKFTGADVLAVDASTSFDDDPDPEIAVARSIQVGGARNALVYAFKANPRTTDQIEAGMTMPLEPIRAKTRVTEDQDALYYALGTPNMIATQRNAGPDGATQGVLVPTQTLVEPGLRINQNKLPPTAERSAASTPRAGLVGVDEHGFATSTLFGAPSSVVRSYDHAPPGASADGVNDVLLGGASGYVILANGVVLTQPLYSYIIAPTTTVLDADTLSSVESYILTDSGVVLMTDDAWITNWGPDNTAPGARAIAANEPNSYWLVGEGNYMWRSQPGVTLPGNARDHMPEATLLSEPFYPFIDDDPTFFAGRSYTFNDIWFRGEEGYVVGSQCLGTCDPEPIVLRTEDGGDSWDVLGPDDFLGDAPREELRRVKFIDGTGWILGAGGTVLWKAPDEATWKLLDTSTTYDLNDIDCPPNDPETCYIVGDDGAVIMVFFAQSGPIFVDSTDVMGFPHDKDLYAIGFQTSERAYIGTENAIYASFDGAWWTELPMNYLPNDVRAINALGDGSGFIYGGSEANGRIWLLHDFHTRSEAHTIPLGGVLGLPEGAEITKVSLEETDVSLGGQTVAISVATSGENWHRVGILEVETDIPIADARNAFPIDTKIEGTTGRDLRFNISMETAGDKTIVSPHLRMLKFLVDYKDGSKKEQVTVTLDFDDDAWKDPAKTTADWNTTTRALRQPIVSEFWTREVNGEVLDMQTGFDVTGDDGRDEVWVATGDIIAENSPDHSIYAIDPNDPTEVVGSDDRVYLLNGLNGNIEARSEPLAGPVRQIRVHDAEPRDGTPEAVYAVAFDGEKGYVYKLDPFDLTYDPAWTIVLEDEAPVDLELGKLSDGRAVAFVGTQRASDEVEVPGRLWALDTTTGMSVWRAIPDELGKYEVKTQVGPGWLFGPYVVEIEVEWEETTSQNELPSQVIRSARFYDHFMVTPPDVLAPPTPVYTARLLVWMQDWG